MPSERISTTRRLRAHAAGLEAAEAVARTLPTADRHLEALRGDLAFARSALRTRAVRGPGLGVPASLRAELDRPTSSLEEARRALQNAVQRHQDHARSPLARLRAGKSRALERALVLAAQQLGEARERPANADVVEAPRSVKPTLGYKPSPELERYAAGHAAAAVPTKAQVGKRLTIVETHSMFGVAVDDRGVRIAFDLRRSRYRPARDPKGAFVTVSRTGVVRPASAPSRDRGPSR